MIRCGYCGDLEWTVRQYGRLTHKEACPYRKDSWSQTYPPKRRIFTKARVLYFFMGLAAAMFVSADVVAEFDKDPNTRTATSYVKQFGKKGWIAAIIVALGPLWLLFHFTVPGFPL